MNGLRCEVISDFSRLEELAPDWRRWAAEGPRAGIFQRWEFARAFWKAYGSSVSLCSIAVYRGEAPIGILPLVRRGGTLEFLGSPESDYNDVLCAEADAAAVMEAVIEFMAGGALNWQSAVLMNVPADSRIARAIPSLSRAATRHLQMVYWCPCPAVTVDPAAPEMLTGLMDKEQLKRYDKKLRKRGKVTFRHFETRDEARLHLDAFFQQHAARWAMSGVRSQFLRAEGRAFYNALIDELEPREHLRFGIVELDGRAVAYHFGFQCNGTLTWYKPAFDVNFWDYCPGDVLIRNLLGHVKAEGLAEFDFTIGDEGFKKRLANTMRDNFTLHIERHPWHPAALARRAARRAEDYVRRHPDRKARVKEWRERLDSVSPAGWAQKALGRLWSRKEMRFHLSPPDVDFEIPGATVQEGSLYDIALLATQCEPAIGPELLREYRLRLKRGCRLLFVRVPDHPVSVFWLGERGEVGLSGDWELPPESPTLAVIESWTAPNPGGGPAPLAALQVLCRHLGAERFWIALPAEVPGFVARLRLVDRTWLGRQERTLLTLTPAAGERTRKQTSKVVVRAYS